NKLQTKERLVSGFPTQLKIQRRENPQEQTVKENKPQPAQSTPAAAPASGGNAAPATPQVANAGGGTAAAPEMVESGDAAAAPEMAAGGSTAETQPAASGGASPGAGGGAASPASPETDPGFQGVVRQVEGVAEQERQHDPAESESQEAQDAAQSPDNEVESQAQDAQVQQMDQQEPGTFNAEAFKAALLERIAAITPTNQEEAEQFQNNNQIDSVRQEVSSQVTQEQEQAAGGIQETVEAEPDTSSIDAREATALEQPEAGEPTDVNAEGAVPQPRSEAEVSAPLQANSQELDQQMAAENVTEEQLANSNEPEFIAALDAKKQAQDHAATAPPAYRAEEQGILTQGQTEAQTMAQTQLGEMHGQREQQLNEVMGLQDETKSQDEQERTRVANEINGIYEQTKTDVETILSDLDTEVTNKFDAGAAAAKQKFEAYVGEKIDAYKQERYGEWWDVTGWDERASDAMFGLPPEVNQFFVDGRQLYIDEMDIALTDIANYVAEKLNEAKERINQGKQEIQEYVAGLPDSLRQVGEDAAQNIQSQFDQLEESVNNKQNELIDSLAQQYSTSLQEVDARIEEMQAENQGLVNQFTDMMGGVFNTIGQIRSMLEGVLAGAAGAIGAILSDPIGFLGNLISGVKQGLDKFVGNIATHLQGGLVAWLTGTMGGLGIQIPDDLFSLEGIFNLVAQILGLTWDYIRSKAVRMFGDPVVAAMEQGLEMFQVLQSEGAIALWEQVQDQFTDLKEQVIDQIKDMVITQVIQSGVSWMLGLLTPAGAFVKAAQTIYNIVMFFVNRGSQVVELVQAITESISAIASGALGQAASLVESALAKALPVAIGFLASLIGVSGLARKVQDVVEGIRKRVDDAIEFVLKKAKQMAASLLRRLGIGRGEENQQNAEQQGDGQPGDGEVGKTINFRAADESHRLWINTQGTSTTVMVASERSSVEAKLNKWQGQLDELPEEKQSEARSLLATASEQLNNTEQEAQEAAQEMQEAEQNPQNQVADAEAEQADNETEAAQQNLADVLKRLLEIFPDSESESDGERKPATIKQIFFVSHDKVDVDNGLYGDWLLKKINSFEPGLLDESLKNRKKIIKSIRGKDETWAVMQGAIYAPFIEDNRHAIQSLEGELDDCAYLLSLERGGSFLADQIGRGKDIPNDKIEKRVMSEEEAERLGTNKLDNHKVQQAADLKARIKSIMSGKENENITIAIAETLVGGGSRNLLIKIVEELLAEELYPNLKFKILLLQQTIHTEDEGEGIVATGITQSNKVQIVTAQTRYILGEDVGYQLAQSGSTSKKPVIVFQGTQEKLVAYQITAESETTARDIIMDLNAGAYTGLLPDIL
ncbi:MAG: hypothetical protein RLP02_29805, partial [Coleofasciculus sp. C2-GNP5-27]